MPDCLQLQQLSVRFHSQPLQSVAVVKQVTLSIAAGEKLALVGESGSGKSVLARSILQLDHDVAISGDIMLNGQSLLGLPLPALRAIRGRRVAMIFQEPMSALNPLHTVGAQIAEVLQLHQRLTRAAAFDQAAALLLRTGVTADKLSAYPHQLSGGQRQRVMIAMALAGEPELLIADEPTTALDVTIQAQILQLLAELQRERGMALLFISHDLKLVRHFADRVAVMQHGELVEVAPTATLFAQPQHPYTRELLAARPQRCAVDVADDAPLAMRVDGLSHAYPQRQSWWRSRLHRVLSPLSFELRTGETLAVVGESGSGKTTLVLALLRLLSAGQSSGQVLLNAGCEFDRLKGAELRQARRDVQIVFQDPFSSLSPRQTVLEIVGEGVRIHQPEIDADARRERVMAALFEVGLPSDILNRYPHEFSGGQRQRIAIARALIMQPKILLLDEPTSALDASSQQQVLQLLAALQQKFGLSFILISHDLAVVRALAHRVIVLKQGQVLEMGLVEQVLSAPQNPYTQQLLASSY